LMTGLVCGALLLALGCSFPDIHFSTEGAGASTAGTGGGNGGGAGTMGTGAREGSTASAGGGGAGGTTTMTGSVGSGGCCDCDGDMQDAKGACGGKDCDDHDPLAYYGEPTYYPDKSMNVAVGFDWDCDGKLTEDPMLKVSLPVCTLKLTQQDCQA